MAPGGGVVETASSVAGALAWSGSDRLLAGDRRQRIGPRDARRKKTGPNATDRGKTGSKHHLISDANGIPLAAILTGANRHDSTQLIPLLKAIPAIGGKPGAPRRTPKCLLGDRAYDCEKYRRHLRARGIEPRLAKRYTEHGSGLGQQRWPIERLISWLHQFKRLRVRSEQRDDIHEALMSLGCAMICWRIRDS